jgi:hypothetical protein
MKTITGLPRLTMVFLKKLNVSELQYISTCHITECILWNWERQGHSGTYCELFVSEDDILVEENSDGSYRDSSSSADEK